MYYFITFLVILLAGVILRLIKKTRTLGNVLAVIGAAALLIPGAFLYLLFFIMYSAEGVLLTRIQAEMLLVGIPGSILVISLFARRLRKKVILIPLVCLFVIGAGMLAQTAYIDSIKTVSTRDIAGYSPYREKTEAYLPDEASTFKLTDELPVIDGATALYPVYAAFYRAVYPEDVNWYDYIDCSTTSGAYEAIINGEADIIIVAGASRAQQAAAAEKGVELMFTPLGHEAFVFIVNSRNPIDDITPEQIADIYTGRITEWKELGVNKLGKIRAYQRSEGSGSQTAFENWFAGNYEIIPAPTEMVADSMGGMYERVADYRNFSGAIGYSFRYYCTEMLKSDEIKLLSIDGISPTVENIINGSYPYSGDFYAVTRSDAGEIVKAFVEWMTGPQGQEIIKKVGYTPLIM